MNKSIFSILCLLLIASPIFAQSFSNNVAVDALLAYNKWRFAHKRTYFSQEEQNFRQQVFFENYNSVFEHNNNPNATYKKALNAFSDMTVEEFSNRILMRGAPTVHAKVDGSARTAEQEDPNLPKSFDWRNYGIMSDIVNQGGCGSCWSFSVAGVLEAVAYLNTRQKITLSKQQMVDCVGAKGFRSYGCNGGWPEEAMKYVIEYGLQKESEYPYVGIDAKCRVEKPLTNAFKISTTRFVSQDANGSAALKNAIARTPVSVAVDASKWYQYSSGVFNDCGKTESWNLNHAVVAVGYDEKGNWIIRNSWGPEWGEKGHMKLAAGNTCGVLLHAVIGY